MKEIKQRKKNGGAIGGEEYINCDTSHLLS